MRTERRQLLLAVLVVVVLAIAARTPGAIAYPLWQDEVASARILDEPTLGGALSRVRETESTPPAWYVLGWALHRAGVPVEGVRALSVAFGAGLAALTLLFARRFLSLPAAFAAATITALGWQLVARGHELRAYALFALVSVAFALLLDACARRPSPGRLAGLSGCVALGLLTHYFFAFALATGLVWLWTWPPARAVRLRVTGAAALGAVPFLVWLPGFLEQVENQRYSWVAGFDLLKAVAVYSTFFWNAGALYVEAVGAEIDPLAAVTRVAILAVVLAGAIVLARRGGMARLCALLATVPVALVAVLWAAGVDLFVTRNLLCAAPFAAVAVAAAVDALPRPAALAAAIAGAGLLALGLVQERTLAPPPYEEIAESLRAEGWRPENRILFYGGAHELNYLGGVYALKSPIGWYLPDHPVLRVAGGPPSRCPFFVVDSRDRAGIRIERRLDCRLPLGEGGLWVEARAP